MMSEDGKAIFPNLPGRITLIPSSSWAFAADLGEICGSHGLASSNSIGEISKMMTRKAAMVTFFCV